VQFENRRGRRNFADRPPGVSPFAFAAVECLPDHRRRTAPGPERLETPGPIFYGSGTVSPGKRFAQFVLGTPAKRAVPVMTEFESQKTSVALPPNRV
jgi:hypothetical protein